LKNFSAALKTCEVIFDIPEKSHRLQEIEAIISKEGFWDNPDQQREVLKERAVLAILFDLALEEDDQQEFDEITGKLKSIDAEISAQEFQRMLGGTDDPLDAIVSINAGAGGTEAQDWAEMLLRMYLRWSEKQNFKNQIIDLQPGEEAGIKSATFTSSGRYAYGFLKAEKGIHRLVRISPFDASGRRHTSFAAVFVYPQVEDEIVSQD